MLKLTVHKLARSQFEKEGVYRRRQHIVRLLNKCVCYACMLMYGKSRYTRTNEGGQHRERIVEELKQICIAVCVLRHMHRSRISQEIPLKAGRLF